MAIGRARNRRLLNRYELFLELSQSYLGSLWAAKVGTGAGAGSIALLRETVVTGADAGRLEALRAGAAAGTATPGAAIHETLEAFVEGASLVTVYDYVEGDTLRVLQSLSTVRRKPIPLGVALRFGTDILRAVQALHATPDAVYGGVSPDGILIGTDGLTRLLGVGLAAGVSRLPGFAQNPERVAYAAPEQLDDRSREDARTDVFSVGILLWEMLSNRRLFIGSDQAVAQKVLAAKIPRLDEVKRRGDFEIPKAVVEVVARALERRVDTRFSTAGEMLAALSGAAELADDATVKAFVEAVAEGTLERRRDSIRDEAGGKPLRPLSESLSSRGSAHAPDPPQGGNKPRAAAEKPGAVAARPAAAKRAAAPPAKPAAAGPPAALARARGAPIKPAAAAGKPLAGAPKPALKQTQLGMPSPVRSAATQGVVVKAPAANAASAAVAKAPVPHRPRMKTMMGIPLAPQHGASALRAASAGSDEPAPEAVAGPPGPAPDPLPVKAPAEPAFADPVSSEAVTRPVKAVVPLEGAPPSEEATLVAQHAPEALEAEAQRAPEPMDSGDEETVRIDLPMGFLRAHVEAARSAAPETSPSGALEPSEAAAPTSTETALRAALSREVDTVDDLQAESPPMTAETEIPAETGATALREEKAEATRPPRMPAPPPDEVEAVATSAMTAPRLPRLSEDPVPPAPKFSEAPSARHRLPANPSAPPPSMFPSKVPPPLIHDPRANFRSQDSARHRAPAPQYRRGVLVGVVASLLIIVAGVVLGRVIVDRMHPDSVDTAGPEPQAATLAPPAANTPQPAPSIEPGPESSASPAAEVASAEPSEALDPAVSAPAEAASEAAPAPAAPAETPGPSPGVTAAPAASTVSTARTPAPARAPVRPAAPRRKKQSKYVPDDI